MSKVFFDRLIVFEEIETEIKNVAKTPEEKEELWGQIEEIVNHKVLDLVLGKLPKEKYDVFLQKFEKSPHDEGILNFLTDTVGEDIEEFLKSEMEKFKLEILKLIKGD